VMVEHRNVVNLLEWHAAAFALSAGCRCSCVAAVGFDAVGWEVWPALTAGATAVLAPAAVTRDPEAFLKWWSSESLDVSFLPTPIAELAFNRKITNPQLRTLLVGGDRLQRQPSPTTFAVVNNYGPTESTVVATSGYIQSNDFVAHIGRPISNTQVHILNSYLQPVPVGVGGEIYIGGAGVARGYLNRPELTADRFIPNPFSQEPRARLYRTGDLGRWRDDGVIEYLGRNDQQVKLRGFRIELGEIEAQLTRNEQVGAAAVLIREDSPGEKRLVAYVRSSKHKAPSVEELRAPLTAILPEYMVPSAFVILEEFPLTPNGKLDRRALPAPELEAYPIRQYEAPQGEVEGALAAIWKEVLRVARVGREDNFFDLGGHSLSAMQVIVRIRSSLSIEMPISMLFEFPTVKQLAIKVEWYRQAHLLDKIAIGGRDVDEMLERVASMPDSKVQELVRELGMESHD